MKQKHYKIVNLCILEKYIEKSLEICEVKNLKKIKLLKLSNELKKNINVVNFVLKDLIIKDMLTIDEYYKDIEDKLLNLVEVYEKTKFYNKYTKNIIETLLISMFHLDMNFYLSSKKIKDDYFEKEQFINTFKKFCIDNLRLHYKNKYILELSNQKTRTYCEINKDMVITFDDVYDAFDEIIGIGDEACDVRLYNK